MKQFYLMRYEDVHGNSGIGVVAEGVIFDSGRGAFTWLTDKPTITTFDTIEDIRELHGHEGRTEIVIEGCRKQTKLFKECREKARLKKSIQNREERSEHDASD